MKTRSLAFISIFVTGIALASLQEGGIKLRRTIKENTTDSYKVESKVKQTIDIAAMGGPQDMTIDSSSRVTYKYGKLTEDKKKQQIEVVVDDMKAEFGGMAQMAAAQMGELPKKFIIKALLDERNTYSDIKLEGLNAQQKLMFQSYEALFQTSTPLFPENAVKIGDTWEQKLPNHPYWGDKAKLDVKIIGEKKVEGVDCYQLDLTGKIEMKIDMGEMAKQDPSGGSMAGMKMIISGPVKFNVATFVEKTTGKIIVVDGKSESEQIIDMSEMGLTMPMKGTTTLSMIIQKPSA